MKYKKFNIKFVFYALLALFTFVIPFILLHIKEDMSRYLLYLLTFGPAIVILTIQKCVKTSIVVPKYGFKIPKNINGKVRVSYSSLLRIYFKGYYLLIKGGYGRYQPPGGVFKYYNNYLEKEFGFIKDTTGEVDDIRGTIDIEKIPSFLNWIDEKNNREIIPDREFEEELIKSKILGKKLFKPSSLVFVERKFKNNAIKYGIHYNMNELIIFDIYDYILDDRQKEYIEKITNVENSQYLFADKDSILREGVSDKNSTAVISDNSRYIILETNDESR